MVYNSDNMLIYETIKSKNYLTLLWQKEQKKKKTQIIIVHQTNSDCRKIPLN